MSKRATVHMGKKRSLQIAEAEIQRLREAYDALNGRATELEEMARARFRIFSVSGLCFTDTPLEMLWVQSQIAGGTVLDLNGFTGKIVIRRD